MRHFATFALLVVGVAPSAWSQEVGPPKTLDAADLVNVPDWVAGLEARFTQIHNPILVAYAKAKLASLICPLVPISGKTLFRESFVDLRNLPSGGFDDSPTVLPVSSFTALWKLVVPPASKCDANAVFVDPGVNRRIESDRLEANARLSRAQITADVDRATQLLDAALSVTDPGDTLQHRAFVRLREIQTGRKLQSPRTAPANLDISLLTAALLRLASSAPDVSDRFFQQALTSTLASPPGPAELAELGRYLFLPSTAGNMELELLHRVGGSSFPDLLAPRSDVDPDMLPAYLGIARGLFRDKDLRDVDPVAAYALAYQLLPKTATLGEAGAEDEMRNAVRDLEAKVGSNGPLVRAAVSPALLPQPSIDGPRREYWLVVRTHSHLVAGRFEEARGVIREFNSVVLRRRVGDLIDFAETAASLKGKEPGWVLSRTSALPQGVKRSLLYAADASVANEKVVALQALQMGAKDVSTFPPPLRACVFSALAAAAIHVDRDQAYRLLDSVIKAENDVAATSDREGFSPSSESSDDASYVRCGVGEAYEAVDTKQGLVYFRLQAGNLPAVSLAEFLGRSQELDFDRLQATVLGLHDDAQLAAALISLAESRLRSAK
jgi:hypothetical protein